MEHIIPITNGQGSINLVDATYAVTSNSLGYNNTSILPAEQEVTEGVTDYAFTIAATGNLTIHTSDDGTDAGVPIVGATFIRCDAEGNTYGNPITSDDDGVAIFSAVPFSEEENGPIVYYKQTGSDGVHVFDPELKNVKLSEEEVTVEIENAEATLRNITLTDANYTNLPLADGNVIFTSN
jgi:hypothetical protein